MKSFSFDSVEQCLVETKPSATLTPAPPEVLSEQLERIWKEWTAGFFEVALPEYGEHAARIVSIVEDGLHVALFGLGQVVRQSNLGNTVPDHAVGIARLHSATALLDTIAKQNVGPAVFLENDLGFRSETFHSPKEQLTMDGSSVSARVIDEILPWPFALPDPVGCPFRDHMKSVYPHVVDMLVDSFEVEQA